MKQNIFGVVIVLAVIQAGICRNHAATTIDLTNRYAYSGNVGWMDWVGNTNNGAVIGEYVCSGYVYSPNIGWINLGNGAPTNQVQYQNLSTNDFGVNQDGYGHLRGYAYSANAGWINFENTGAAKVDLYTGQFTGYAWSANCGWISLSNATAYVQADSIKQGVLAADGLPVAWLLDNFGTTNVNTNADPTGKGMTIQQDYLAGTDPNNATSLFEITYVARNGTESGLVWDTVGDRYYTIQTNSALANGMWGDMYRLDIAGWNNGYFYDGDLTNRFYRIRVYRPLMPTVN
jgi:hypothetical protein